MSFKKIIYFLLRNKYGLNRNFAKRQMKVVFRIFLLCFSSFQLKAQELYYQSTYKGGVSYDGKSYYSLDWYNADSIKFQNSVPAGCTIKKAFLISLKFSCSTFGVYPAIDYPISFNYNGHSIQFDTSDNATPLFYTRPIQVNAQCWMCVKDVTTLTQNNNNMLVTPCQGACYGVNECTYYDYDGFYLLLLYENNTYSNVNVALYLNNMTYVPIMNYTLNNLNPINTANDVALSIESVDDQVSPYLQYQLTSSVSTFTLGTLRDVSLSGSTNYETGMGSFQYQNGVLTGLNGNINSPSIDSTDALCNIKTYLTNNTASFSLTANSSTVTTVNGSDGTEAFILAYSTPCLSVPNNADSLKIYKLCAGQSTQLNASAGYTNYNWFPTTGLSSASIANPNVHTTGTTNYICYVKDAAGCMHTEHAQVIIHTPPTPQSFTATAAVCGVIQGTLTITPNYHNYGYGYSLNSATTQTNTTFSNLSAGHYTLTITDSIGCMVKDTFNIKEVNNAQAQFYLTPYSGCEPLSIYGSNLSSNTNAYVWYVNGDSATTQNLSYTFTDTGMYNITLFTYENLRACSATATQTVLVKYCPPPPPDSISITVPNIFSPNADGTNDTWQLLIYNRNYTISNYQCTIYDRWGLKMFSSTTANEAWSGRTTSGESCSADAYFYIIKFIETNSKGTAEQKEFKGFLELVR